ncbi:MAG: HlyC/CorC family transporter [Thermotogae bacterium]|nr:HlyC/CorC family transporter [Thermotogota bacterium]
MDPDGGSSWFLALVGNASFGSIFLEFLILLILIALSSFFSGSETALTAMNKIRLRDISRKEKDEEKGKIVEDFIKRPNKMLTAILIGNNFVNIAASSLATIIAIQLFPKTNIGKLSSYITGVMTFLILIFGEITPKTHAKQHPEHVFRRVIKIISVFTFVLTPVIYVLMLLSNAINKLRGSERISEGPFITEDEIILMADIGAKEGIFEKEESRMIKDIFKFNDIAVKEIMVPRIDMVCLQDNAGIERIIEVIKENHFSRIPVYHQSVDKIVGVLYAKDILSLLSEHDRNALREFKAKNVAKPALFIPETKKIDDLLADFRKMKIQIAIVVDEFGGTSGLVTLEDVIEEIFGEIQDEYDEEEDYFIKDLGNKRYEMDGRTPINQIERFFDVEFPETDYETIGGYICDKIERMPGVGEEIELMDKYRVKVLKTSPTRIVKVEIYKIPSGVKDNVRHKNTESQRKH